MCLVPYNFDPEYMVERIVLIFCYYRISDVSECKLVWPEGNRNQQCDVE
jgi:hypothetical protein